MRLERKSGCRKSERRTVHGKSEAEKEPVRRSPNTRLVFFSGFEIYSLTFLINNSEF